MTTSEPSQLTIFADELILCPEAHRANQLRSLADGRAVLTSDGSGRISCESSESAPPVGSWQRILLESVLSSLTEQTGSSLSWRRRGTPSFRSWWVLGRSEPRTDESASGSWPTVTQPYGNNRGGGSVLLVPIRPSLEGMARLAWPTATAQDSISSGAAAYSTDSGRHPGTTLTDAANGLWASPSSPYRKGSVQGDTLKRRREMTRGVRLPEQLARAGLLDQGSHSTSGRSRDWPTARAGGDALVGGSGNLAQLDGTELARGLGNRGSLNSRWVAQLMGYPPDWCELPSDALDALTAKPSKPTGTP